jgi:TRAP-type C4-dicarboxylate transport system permease small subunit
VSRAWDRVVWAAYLVAGAVLIADWALVVANVVMRRVFQQPVLGTVDFTTYALVISTLFAAAVTFRNDQHIRMDFLLVYAGPRARRVLDVTAHLVGAAVFLALLYYSSAVLWEYYERGTNLIGDFTFRKAWVFAAVPIGMLILAVEFLRRTWQLLRGTYVPPRTPSLTG